LLILPLLLQVATPSPALGCFDQGPAEGMCADTLLSKEGAFEVWSLKPAAAAGAPIPPELEHVVSGLIQAYDSHEAAFQRELLTANSTEVFCADDVAVRNGCLTPKPLVAWPFTTYQHNRPYLMKDGRVRVEWMESGKLKYLSMITFAGNRVRDIRTTPASMAFKRPG
jgi:hypothetical protein